MPWRKSTRKREVIVLEGKVKKIMVYLKNGSVVRIKNDFALFMFESTDESRAISATSDLTGEDNLELISLLSQLVANSVLPDIDVERKGAAYMTIINIHKECARAIYEAHTEELHAHMTDEVHELVKPKIILPGQGGIQ